MRRILVEHARTRSAAKRGGLHIRVECHENVPDPAAEFASVVHLDRTLKRLAAIDERLSRVVELRYFGGLSVEETADVAFIFENTKRVAVHFVFTTAHVSIVWLILLNLALGAVGGILLAQLERRRRRTRTAQ